LFTRVRESCSEVVFDQNNLRLVKQRRGEGNFNNRCELTRTLRDLWALQRK